jgi:hypothetical protein
VLAPRGTPQGIVDTLNREITAQLDSQGLRAFSILARARPARRGAALAFR